MNCAECETKDCYRGKVCTPYRDEIAEKLQGADLETMKAAASLP